jgi:hypothetical protein
MRREQQRVSHDEEGLCDVDHRFLFPFFLGLRPQAADRNDAPA